MAPKNRYYEIRNVQMHVIDEMKAQGYRLTYRKQWGDFKTRFLRKDEALEIRVIATFGICPITNGISIKWQVIESQLTENQDIVCNGDCNNMLEELKQDL